MKIALKAIPFLLGVFAALPISAQAQAPASSADISASNSTNSNGGISGTNFNNDAKPSRERLADSPDSRLQLGKPPSNETKTREIRANGKTSEVEVKTPNTKYTVRADQQVGNAQRGSVQGSSVSVARFNIVEFGGSKPAKPVANTPGGLPPAPPPAISPAAKSVNAKPASAPATSK